MSHSANQVPPEVANYLKGPTAESRQFDFLIGHWDVAATKFKEDGACSSITKRNGWHSI